MKNMKIYGNDKTNLTLTPAAEAVYNQCDPLRIVEHDDGSYSISGIEDRDGMTAAEVNQWLEDLGAEMAEDAEEKIVLEISRINIKSETFCTPWNGSLYCVDICEDAEDRSAWLYRYNSGVKSLMWGEPITQTSREEFLHLIFTSIPDYVDDYEAEYGD